MTGTLNAGGEDKKLKYYRLSLWAGAAMLLCGAGALILSDTANDFYLVLIFLGNSIMFWEFWKYTGIKKPTRDERAMRLNTLAGMYSWYTGLFVLLAILFVIGNFDVHVGIMQVLGIAILAQVLSFLGFHIYFSRKGDVN